MREATGGIKLDLAQEGFQNLPDQDLGMSRALQFDQFGACFARQDSGENAATVCEDPV
jgi:hypothetical protein